MTRGRFVIAALACVIALCTARSASAGPLLTTYAYHLATSTGVVPFNGARLSYDPIHDEIYVLGDGPVRVFNETGMEIYAFGDSEVGSIVAVGVLPQGDLVTLSLFEGGKKLLHCNFRGELIEAIEPTGVPEQHRGFAPTGMKYANGHIYLADQGQMTFMVLDEHGKFEKFFDVFPMLELDPAKRESAERLDYGVKGFNVDKDGNILFTVQPLFRAYVLSLDGTMRSFGVRGSAPGKFNVLGGIASDEAGNFYVTDILKSAVIAFDRDFRFIREFGYRGRRPSNIISPIDIAVGHGKIFVSQWARRGVGVFKIQYD